MKNYSVFWQFYAVLRCYLKLYGLLPVPDQMIVILVLSNMKSGMKFPFHMLTIIIIVPWAHPSHPWIIWIPGFGNTTSDQLWSKPGRGQCCVKSTHADSQHLRSNRTSIDQKHQMPNRKEGTDITSQFSLKIASDCSHRSQVIWGLKCFLNIEIFFSCELRLYLLDLLFCS